ncbi:hypothetical protein AAL_06790 [Moelleriella libera RCEF 2490]|uniref:Uncharacterized protein n=1 Tax=Moelleriella libera RCEF 2490 TaxID=1081109 RepID=A0A167YA33_9HYPO|nr:hypothetical protein AAL_06790 [Moelleriella libera RCEF 2490]
MAGSGGLQWAIILVLTALVLSLVVIGQVVATYWSAYVVAPQEIVTFIDTVDFSIQENESYDRDMAKVQRLEDKIRLGRLLREIQRGGDDLREQLNGLLANDGATTLRTSARLLWSARRTQLQDRVRRLDLLRMRFLVVYMGIMTSVVDKNPPPPPPLPRDAEKTVRGPRLTSDELRKLFETEKPARAQFPPVRRLTTQAIGHQENVIKPQRQGWAGVVEELQTSPRMQQRHASVELAMARTTPE